MSLVTNLTSAFTRVATEVKALRTLINGNAIDNSALTTTAKSNLVLAINEVKDAVGAGSPTTLSDLTDVTITSAANGHILRHNGTEIVNVVGTTYFDAAGAATTAATAMRDEILGAGVPAALDTLDELAAALGDDANFAATVTTALSNKQPLDADLTQIAGLVSAADRLPYATGAGTWSLATFTAAGRALVDDADAAAQRVTLSVYSQADIGDPTTNFVTTFEAGLV